MLRLLAMSMFAFQQPAAENFELSPVEVGEGPILLIRAQTKEKTRFEQDELFVVDPAGARGPQLLSKSANWLLRHYRLDRNRILVDTYEDLLVLDLAKGASEPLDPKRKMSLIAFDGETYWLRENIKREGFVDLSDVIVNGIGSSYRLCKMRNDCAISAVDDVPVNAILEVTKDHFWGLCGADLWRIAKDGGEKRKLFTFPKDEIVIGLHSFALAPNGKRFAFSAANREPESLDRHDLFVVSAETGREILRMPKIDVAVLGASSSMPRLRMTWLDDDRIRFSETKRPDDKGEPNSYKQRRNFERNGYFQWVEMEAVTGKRVKEEKYSGIDIFHRRPVNPAAAETEDAKKNHANKTEGRFEWSEQGLRFHGETEPLPAKLGNRVGDAKEIAWLKFNNRDFHEAVVAPRGRWAALQVSTANKDEPFACFLADGETKRITRLFDNRHPFGFIWLPGHQVAPPPR